MCCSHQLTPRIPFFPVQPLNCPLCHLPAQEGHLGAAGMHTGHLYKQICGSWQFHYFRDAVKGFPAADCEICHHMPSIGFSQRLQKGVQVRHVSVQTLIYTLMSSDRVQWHFFVLTIVDAFFTWYIYSPPHPRAQVFSARNCFAVCMISGTAWMHYVIFPL